MIARLSSVVLCCLLLFPAVAEGKKPKRSPTQIDLVGADGVSVQGQLRTSFKRCLRDRTVKLIVNGSIVRTAHTARNGSFSIALADIASGASAFTVKAARKRIGNRLCERDTADVAIDFATLDGGASNGAFRGLIFSNIEACEPGRTISVYEISSGEPVPVGSTVTDASGAWTLAQASGTYQAQAEPALVGGGDAFTYCPLVVSNAWTFEEPPPEETP